MSEVVEPLGPAPTPAPVPSPPRWSPGGVLIRVVAVGVALVVLPYAAVVVLPLVFVMIIILVSPPLAAVSCGLLVIAGLLGSATAWRSLPVTGRGTWLALGRAIAATTVTGVLAFAFVTPLPASDTIGQLLVVAPVAGLVIGVVQALALGPLLPTPRGHWAAATVVAWTLGLSLGPVINGVLLFTLAGSLSGPSADVVWLLDRAGGYLLLTAPLGAMTWLTIGTLTALGPLVALGRWRRRMVGWVVALAAAHGLGWAGGYAVAVLGTAVRPFPLIGPQWEPAVVMGGLLAGLLQGLLAGPISPRLLADLPAAPTAAEVAARTAAAQERRAAAVADIAARRAAPGRSWLQRLID
jgi:hypothetical protein